MSDLWKLILEAILTGAIAFCTMVNVFTVGQVNEAVDRIHSERAADDERVRQVNAFRKQQIVNEATLLYRQEECLKAAGRLESKLKGLGD